MISLIVAYTKNRVIGNNGKIPWNLKNEKKRFKELTTGNVVIMGRKTYEEIGRPLPNRTNIVISTTKNFDCENCTTVKSLEEALDICKGEDVYISGGAGIYKAVLPFVEKMYITEIDTIIEGDTYFPNFDESKFTREVVAEFNEELTYRYTTYTKN